jgi:hypothetical protein
MILSANEVAWLAGGIWTTTEDLITGVAVAYAESKYDTCAIGTSSTGENTGQQDLGLWQCSTRWNIAKFYEIEGDWRNPIVNTSIAALVWEELGWTAWHTYTSGAYLKYVALGQMAVPRPLAIHLPANPYYWK